MNPPLYLTTTNPPTLIGQQCTACGRNAFPGNPYGCEACGAEAAVLVEAGFAGRGRLSAFTTTAQPSNGAEANGFTVGVIELEQGFTIRAMLDHGQRERLAPGIEVCAAATQRPGDQGFDLHFTPTAGPAE